MLPLSCLVRVCETSHDKTFHCYEIQHKCFVRLYKHLKKEFVIVVQLSSITIALTHVNIAVHHDVIFLNKMTSYQATPLTKIAGSAHSRRNVLVQPPVEFVSRRDSAPAVICGAAREV